MLWKGRQLGVPQVFLLYVAAANADGQMSYRKLNRLNSIARSLGPKYTGGRLHRIIEKHRVSPRAPESFGGLLGRLPGERRRNVVLTLFTVVFADHTLGPSTREWLGRLFGASELPEVEITSARCYFEREPLVVDDQRTEWLRKLELPAGAGLGDIKKAFRRKASDYHPDLLADVSPAVRELASEKMREINEAYRQLLRRSSPPVKADLYVIDLAGGLINCSTVGQGDISRCPVCRKKNRLPEAGTIPLSRCGSCHALLALPMDVYA